MCIPSHVFTASLLLPPQDVSTSYDSTWAADSVAAATSAPAQSGMEAVMLSQDKIYVVLAVVLIIWIGIALFIWRTDRRLDRLDP